MIKFIHKKHIQKAPNIKALIIYYSLSDIVLGALLVILVAFFIYNYLEVSFQSRAYTYTDSQIMPTNKTVAPKPSVQEKVKSK